MTTSTAKSRHSALLGGAAHGLSLGGCWLGVHPRLERVEGIRRLLDLPDTMIPVAAVAIGWPAQDLKARTRFRKDAVTER